MAQLELTPVEGNEHGMHVLGSLGTMWTAIGLMSQGATAQAGAGTWRFERHGVLVPTMHATDASGAAVGRFQRRAFGGGGELSWAGRELELRMLSAGRSPCWALLYGERRLAELQSRDGAIDTVLVTLDDDGPYVPPGLLLFGAFIAQLLGDDDRLPAFSPGGGMLST